MTSSFTRMFLRRLTWSSAADAALKDERLHPPSLAPATSTGRQSDHRARCSRSSFLSALPTTFLCMMCVSWLLMSNLADRVLLSVLGVGVSLYALMVEVRRERDPQYRAACDFSDRFSCSKALCSPYGKGFGVVSLLVGKDHFLNQRNCTLGILFYLSQIVFAFLPNQVLWSCVLYYTSVIAGLGCVYLAFILFFILRDICIVCIATYVINAALIYLNYNLYLGKHLSQ